MFKKTVKFILISVFIISLIGTIFCAVKDVKVQNWHKTILTVTFIGKPDGTVFGDYTDAKGQLHQNKPAYYEPFFSGYSKDAEQYYGKVVTIMENPETGEVLNYDRLFRNNIIFFSLTIVSGVLLFISRKHRKEA